MFETVAWLFKINHKKLVKDIIPTFDVLLPMFSAKDYLQIFTAESFGFLIRKLERVALQGLLTRMVRVIEDDSHDLLVDGLSMLLIETIKV